MYWIGYDIGSSSVKAALIKADDGRVIGLASYPEKELKISAPMPDWGEQDPETWWECVCQVTRKLLTQTSIKSRDIKGVGISYQMHGLVLVDNEFNVLRPSIIWCDSRAVNTGSLLLQQAGMDNCMNHLLNSPGNFTLSKLKWVQDNEPDIYDRTYKFMLPGDYISLRLTNECITTPSGLSEGIMWDFKTDSPADWLFEKSTLDTSLIPEIRPTFSEHGFITKKAAEETGLPSGIPILYRAGDQPNNALSLNVFEPGEIAATAGTSGVVYAVSGHVGTKEGDRINNFAHVNHTKTAPRIGKLLCINGTGIQYSWLKDVIGNQFNYEEMNRLSEQVSIGSDNVVILPFGNGAERMLENKNLGSQILNLQFNRHSQNHLIRAALEGIAFSFVYGIEILQNDGVNLSSIKAGNDNLFQSAVFADTISTLTGSEISITETTGAVGAARAAAYSHGDFRSFGDAVALDPQIGSYTPKNDPSAYVEAYERWKSSLKNYLTS